MIRRVSRRADEPAWSLDAFMIRPSARFSTARIVRRCPTIHTIPTTSGEIFELR